MKKFKELLNEDLKGDRASQEVDLKRITEHIEELEKQKKELEEKIQRINIMISTYKKAKEAKEHSLK